MNGKGRGPEKGYNSQAYADNYDRIFRQIPNPTQRKEPMNPNTPTNPPTPAPTPGETPRTDALRLHPDSMQHVQFEGCDSVIIAPEDHETLHNLARTLERELTSALAALAAKDREIEAFKANNRYMRGHTAGYEEARSKFEPRLFTEEVLHKAARARAEKAEAERDHWKNCHSSAEAALEEMTGWRNECGFRYNQAKAERDALRAEVERLTKERLAALAAAQQDKERLIEAVQNTLSNIPGYHEGHFIVMHYDGEGRELGPEYIDPFCVVGHIDQSLRAAIDQARSSLPESGKDQP